MSDTFTETTSKSWFSRIKSAFSGITTGFILVIAAIAALFWNEGRAVKTAAAYTEGAGQVISIDPFKPIADFNGKLVHFTGALTPNGIAMDAELTGVRAPEGATQLVRKVEMYQWDQDSTSTKKKKLGGSEETVTTYSYKKVWSEGEIDSNRFKKPEGHTNPPMALKSQKFSVESGKVGTININGSKFNHLGKTSPVTLSNSQIAELREHFDYDRDVERDGSNISISVFSGAQNIGDLRVSFESRDIETLSAVGKLQDGELVSFETSNGRNISMINSGDMPADKMFENALSGNTLMTWVLRAVGFLAMLAGFKMIFSIIGVLGDVVPLIGDVFRFATGMAAFALTAVISTLIIGFAWIYHRPIIGMTILTLGLVLAVAALIIGKAKARKTSIGKNLGTA